MIGNFVLSFVGEHKTQTRVIKIIKAEQINGLSDTVKMSDGEQCGVKDSLTSV